MRLWKSPNANTNTILSRLIFNCLLYLHCIYDKPLFFSAASVWTRRENFCESVRVSVCVCDKPLAASRRTYTLAAMSTYHRNGFMRFIMVFWHSNWSLFSTYMRIVCYVYTQHVSIEISILRRKQRKSTFVCVVRFSWIFRRFRSTLGKHTIVATASSETNTFGSFQQWNLIENYLFLFVLFWIFWWKIATPREYFICSNIFCAILNIHDEKKNEWKYTETCKINVLYEDARRLGASITFDFSHCSPSVAFSRSNGNKARTPDTCSICE